MAPPKSSSLTFLLFVSSFAAAMAAHSVTDFGAKPDGRTDSSEAFRDAWAAACQASGPAAAVSVPPGKFLLSKTEFSGPCKSKKIDVSIQGTLVAPSSYSASEPSWITFANVEGLSIHGGTLDGQGEAFWACKKSGCSCPVGTNSLSINNAKNVLISGIKVQNSKKMQMAIHRSTGVKVVHATITAPRDSPNTDGIHVQMSSFVTILHSVMRTGDDCISMGPGSAGVWIENVTCGPGHGISIGSLGLKGDEAGVENITVKSATFTGTDNGLRIKTWGKSFKGFVKDVTFDGATMNDVRNPIIIDQNYCPHKKDCSQKDSGVKISHVTYNNVNGSSATPVGLKFDCSPSNPCTGISLKGVKLTYQNKKAEASCKNAQVAAAGAAEPLGCR